MIKVEGLTYCYPEATENALDNVNFEIADGEIFGFLGPSGAGKSTCQKVLYKVIHDYTGSIRVQGKDLKLWGSEYFEGIGVGFELPNHYGKLTAKENLELFGAFYPVANLSPVEETLDIVGLSKYLHSRVDSFSKGMKMRLNFVRAIQHNPDILFFDEPTTGMDPTNAHIIKMHIQALKKEGKTIFITTHDMAIADELCDRVAFIVDGAIVVIEQPAILKLKHGSNSVKVELVNGSSACFPTISLGKNREFLKYIEDEDILRIHSQEATLEEVFIQVTGKSLAT